MSFTIDRLDSALGRIGLGPIASASSISSTDKLDAAGNIHIGMPATDPRTAAFTVNAYHYVRAVIDGDATDQRRVGIIKERGTGSESMGLSLSGPNLLGELLHTHVGTLPLESAVGSGLPMPAASVLGAILGDSGWTSTGMPSNGVYYKFGDETRLAALRKVAELIGDHFRQSKTVARQIEWLPTTAAGFNAVDSGLRAVDAGSPAALESNDDVCLIVGGLQEVADGHQRITRLYPRGAGNAGARLYLNGTTRVAPAGYTLVINADPPFSYLAHTANDAAGSISGVETLRDIAPLDESATALASASNMLFDAALVSLRRRLEAQRSFRLKLTKVRGPLLVGTSIRVISRHFVDGYGWMLVDDHAMMLDTTWRWTADGGEAEVDVEVTL